MGLDMYLYRKSYVQNWAHQTPQERHNIIVKKGDIVREDIKPDRIAYIIEQVAYWRKFNALHGWFVNNCGEGIDECQEIRISSQDLQDLLNTLIRVEAAIEENDEDKIGELLPPTEGFFFGSYGLDEYYKEDVKETIKIVEELITDTDADYYYQASW